jgi:hypothetical protein
MYNTLLKCLSKSNRQDAGELAEDIIFNQMIKERRMEPQELTIRTAMACCRNVGELDRVERLKRLLYRKISVATSSTPQHQEHSPSLPPGPLKKPLKSAPSMDPARRVKLFP